MSKKKVSGQTIAIIILALLLLFSVALGGVYAYYSFATNKIAGKVIMANLTINFSDGTSGISDITISNNTNVVPNEKLGNSPLMVTNNSNTPIYLAVFYAIEAYEINPQTSEIEYVTNYDMSKPLLSGADMDVWTDQLFQSSLSGEEIKVRCLLNLNPIRPETHLVHVIDEDCLRLGKYLNDDFQRKNICFSFRAVAIAANSLEIDDGATVEQKFNKIVNAMYEALDYRTLL